MKKLVLFIAMIFSLISGLATAQITLKDKEAYTEYVRVQFKKEAFKKIDKYDYAILDNINPELMALKTKLAKLGEIKFKKVFANAIYGDTIKIDRHGKAVKVKDVSQFYDIIFREPVKMWGTVYELRKLDEFKNVDPPVFAVPDAIPNDQDLKGEQWYLKKVNANAAWEITSGDGNVGIAIVDKGVDINHEDISSKILGGEIGYSSEHGTRVAGLAGAVTNNGKGIASLGWNIKLIPYNFDNGTGFASDINAAASNSSVDVINCSWKILAVDPNDNTKYINYDDPSTRLAIQNALSLDKIIIASGGNPPSPVVWSETTYYPSQYPPYQSYPAAYDGVIAVSATNSSDAFPSGYNYGAHIDISAPSISMLTTDINNNYHTGDGTSFGAPLVSALAALILSIDRNLTYTQVTQYITSTADDLGTTGYDYYYGYGRINAYSALLNIVSGLANSNQSWNDYATAKNNSRHLVKDAGGYYHMVFTSGGEIFYRKSTNGGYNWSTAIRISAGNGFNKYPCITLDHYYGTPSVTWQRETQVNTYEIYFAASRDNGNTWNATDRHVVTSLQCSANPLPVIQGTQYGTLKVIAFKGNTGISAYKTTSLCPASNNDWQVYTISATSQEYNVTLSDDWAYFKTLLAYQDGNPANIKYTFFDGTSWYTPYSLSSIVPGTAIHQTPTIANNPNGSGVHIAWERITNSGSSATDHTIIYRRANNCNDWRNEYFATYYQGQQLPSITCTDLNEVYLLFQLIPSMGNEIYKQFFNGSSWGTPTLVASNSVYPSVSKGKTDAKYIYTTGVSQPYTVTVSSDFLSKQNEQINFNNYSRSIAIMNNPEEYLEVVMNKMYFKMKDGSVQRVDFLPADLEELKTKEKFDLTTGNVWDLMKGIKDLTIPVGADELVFDYTVRGENIDKVFEGNPKKIDLSVDLNLTTKAEKAEKINSMDIVKGKIAETKFSDVIQLNSLNAERGFDKMEIGLKVKGITAKTTAFASLGHIFDYANKDTQNETIASKLNDAEAVSEETLTSENYPNPFNPSTLIRFAIKNSSKVTLKVYDVLGREVAELLNGFHESGTYEIPFNGSNLPSGVYFYHLTSNANSLTKKMLLLK